MSSNFSQIFTSFTRFNSKLANTKSLNSSQHRILAVSITLVILKISIIVRQLSQKKNYILLVRKIGRSKCLIKVKTLLAWLVCTSEKVFKMFILWAERSISVRTLGRNKLKKCSKTQKNTFFSVFDQSWVLLHSGESPSGTICDWLRQVLRTLARKKIFLSKKWEKTPKMHQIRARVRSLGSKQNFPPQKRGSAIPLSARTGYMEAP